MVEESFRNLRIDDVSDQVGESTSEPNSDGASILSQDNLRLEDESDDVTEGVNNYDKVR